MIGRLRRQRPAIDNRRASARQNVVDLPARPPHGHRGRPRATLKPRRVEGAEEPSLRVEVPENEEGPGRPHGGLRQRGDLRALRGGVSREMGDDHLDAAVRSAQQAARLFIRDPRKGFVGEVNCGLRRDPYSVLPQPALQGRVKLDMHPARLFERDRLVYRSRARKVAIQLLQSDQLGACFDDQRRDPVDVNTTVEPLATVNVEGSDAHPIGHEGQDRARPVGPFAREQPATGLPDRRIGRV